MIIYNYDIYVRIVHIIIYYAIFKGVIIVTITYKELVFSVFKAF